MKRGSRDLDLVERGAERRDGRLHRGRVERAGDVERGSRGGRARRRPPRRASSASRGAGQHDLAGRVVVGDGDAGGLGDRRARPRRSRRRARASSRVRRPRPSAAAQDDELAARRRASSTPAAASAASSPSEWPAAAHGCVGRSASQPASDAQKIAGCAKRVLSSTRGERILADELDAALEQLGRARATRSRISGVWLPWPGNRTAGAWGSNVGKVIGKSPSQRPYTDPWSRARPYPPSGGWVRDAWGWLRTPCTAPLARRCAGLRRGGRAGGRGHGAVVRRRPGTADITAWRGEGCGFGLRGRLGRGPAGSTRRGRRAPAGGGTRSR